MNYSPSEAVNSAINAFNAAQSAHAENMLKLKDITEAITRCKKEKDHAQTESKDAETNWRSRFRSLRGEMTEELKNEHRQRISQLELAKEFADLIDDLELDHKAAMLNCAGTARKLLAAHKYAFVTYADYQWEHNLRNLSPSLVRAIKLKLQALSMVSIQEQQSEYYREPENVVSALIGNKLNEAAKKCQFEMDIEPILQQIGLYHPSLSGVDMALVNSPAKTNLLHAEIKEKRAQRQQEQ